MTRTSKGGALNWTEYISMNVGFSIYAGWVTSATILNLWYFLKSRGVQEPQYNEEKLAVITLWLALAVYVGITVYGGHSWYGAVFIWVCFAISAEIQDSRPEYTDLLANVQWIGILHAISITGLTSYLATLSFNDIYDQEKGLFY